MVDASLRRQAALAIHRAAQGAPCWVGPFGDDGESATVLDGTFILDDLAEAALTASSWRPRTETPPAQLLWASDGLHVWFIHGTGAPLPPEMDRVRWWQPALVPPLPPTEVTCAPSS